MWNRESFCRSSSAGEKCSFWSRFWILCRFPPPPHVDTPERRQWDVVSQYARGNTSLLFQHGENFYLAHYDTTTKRLTVAPWDNTYRFSTTDHAELCSVLKCGDTLTVETKEAQQFVMWATGTKGISDRRIQIYITQVTHQAIEKSLIMS